MERGFIKLYRSSVENGLYFCEPFGKWQAWQDLILLANYKPSSFSKRGVFIEVPRGALAWSQKGLAARWKWSRHKVSNFLKRLEMEHQIAHQINNVTTLIIIVNYDKYQDANTKKDTKRTPKGHQKDTSKEGKEGKEQTGYDAVDNNLPSFISKISWDSFVDMREKLKSAMTDNAKKLAISKLTKFNDEGQDVNAILDQSTMNSYKGLFEVNKSKQKQDNDYSQCGYM
jgi:hypothetical protein